MPESLSFKSKQCDWLDIMPAHWKLLRLKLVADVQLSNVDKHTVEGETQVFLCNYLDVYRNEKITTALNFMLASASDEQIERLSLASGDVLITKDSETPDDIGIPAYVPEYLSNVVCGYHLALIRPITRILLGSYLCRVFESSIAKAKFSISSNGITRFSLGKYEISNSYIPIPPLEEQRAIAEMLDAETARLDELIAEKERLLSLLTEKRRALITRAATRGLDTTAPLRDSGLEWLGAIPAHWETPPVYARYKVQLGKMLDEKQIRGTHLACYLRNIDVQWGSINTKDLPVMDFDEDDRKTFSLKYGDILICEGGEIGRTAIWKEEIENCYYQKALHRLRPATEKDFPEFFVFAMRAMVDVGVFLALSSASTIHHLPAEKLRVIRYPSPPVEEQRAIVAYIAAETRKLDEMHEVTARTIGLLKERRAALIAAAVTGRLEVRNSE